MMDDLTVEKAAVAALSLEGCRSMREAKARWVDMAPTLKEQRRERVRLILRYMAACGVASFLAGCKSAPIAPEPIIRTVYVDRPVMVTCAAEEPQTAPYPDTEEALLAAPNIFAQAQLLMMGRKLREANEAILRASRKGCEGASVAPPG